MTGWAPVLPVAAVGLILACESPTPPTGMPSEPHTIAARDRVLGFSVAELPTLGGAIAGAIAINPAGATSGFSDLPDPDLDVVRQPVIWSSGGGLNVLSTPGDGGSAIDINAAGDAVGIILRGASVTTAAFWPADGSVVDLGGLGRHSSVAQDINESRVVAGYRRSADGVLDPFRWHPVTGLELLSTLGGDWSLATGVNELGQIVGGSRDADGEARAVTWTETGRLVDLGVAGGSFTNATAINDIGEIVGMVEVDGEERGFFIKPGEGITDLGGLGGDFTRPTGINNLGHVVGASSTAAGEFHGFVWTREAGMAELPPPPDGNFSVALDINDRGMVAGYWGNLANPTSATTPVVWTLQLSEPSSNDLTTRILAGVENLKSSGSLSEGEYSSIVARLDATDRRLEAGQEAAAVRLLQAIERQLHASVTGGRLDGAALGPVLELIARAIGALESN